MSCEAVPPAAADAGVAAPTPRAVAVAKEKACILQLGFRV